MLAMMACSDESNIEASASASYVGFFSKKSDKCMDIAAAIPGITEGEPYSASNGSFSPVSSLALLGPAFGYFVVKKDAKYNIVEASATDPGRGLGKEEVLAITLAFTPAGIQVGMTTFRTAKCKVAKDILGGHKRFADADAVAKSGPVGKVLASLPAALRVTGDLEIMAKVSTSGEMAGTTYYSARARCRLLNDVETQLMLDAIKCPDFNAKVASVKSYFDERKAAVEELIAATV